MKKQLKLGPNKIEITISAQAYLPPPIQRENLLTSLTALLYDRRYSVAITLNNFPLFAINTVEEIDLKYFIEIIEDVCERHLNDLAVDPKITMDGYLNEIGYKA